MTHPNRLVFARTILEMARTDSRIVVLTSDSRGSAKLSEFAEELPEQFLEVGIAEQNLVGIAAGLATCGKVPFACSPSCFLSMRSIEQVKVDVAYSGTNVKLIGISSGVSYGALGATHHSLQDFAVLRAIPNLTVIAPSDNQGTEILTKQLLDYPGPVYMRLGRNEVRSIPRGDSTLQIGKGEVLLAGSDVSIIAIGEAVQPALEAGYLLQRQGISARVIEIHTLKPLDEEVVLSAARETQGIVTVEEHSIHGGLGAAVAELVSQNCHLPMSILGIPDEPAVHGTQTELFAYYGLTAQGIASKARALLEQHSQTA